MKKNAILFWSIVLQILLLSFVSATLAEAPQNYFKGKFYKSVKNNFLVATEKMSDDRFKKTIIVMLENNEQGAWGLVVNKPIGQIPLRFLVNISQNSKSEKKELYDVNIPIFWGGPVDEKQIHILHSKEYKSETTENYKDISVTLSLIHI